MNGQGIGQNFSTAKEYYGKACDLGLQLGCDDYRKLNEKGY
nr:Sel1 repeat protein [uncultured Campylobacter sp.]